MQANVTYSGINIIIILSNEVGDRHNIRSTEFTINDYNSYLFEVSMVMMMIDVLRPLLCTR